MVWSYSGVRPLFDEDGSESASAVSRDYVLDLEEKDGEAPLLNVFGGKITTYRRLSEHALQKLKPFFPKARRRLDQDATLPGGEIADADFERFVAAADQALLLAAGGDGAAPGAGLWHADRRVIGRRARDQRSRPQLRRRSL